MPATSRLTIDTAGGVITGALQTGFKVNGKAVAVKGDAIAGHGSGPHAGPAMAQGMANFRVNGIPVCCAGHLATCGHAATGSTAFHVNGSTG